MLCPYANFVLFIFPWREHLHYAAPVTASSDRKVLT